MRRLALTVLATTAILITSLMATLARAQTEGAAAASPQSAATLAARPGPSRGG